MPRARYNPELPQSQIRKLLNTAIRRALPGGLLLTGRDLRDLRDGIFNEWVAAVGIPSGQARATATGILVDTDAERLVEEFRQIARDQVVELGYIERYRQIARFDDPEIAQKVTEGVAEPVTERAPEEREFPLLAELREGSKQDQTRAALIAMHLGEYVIPGQPTSWATRRVHDPEKGTVKIFGAAANDFRDYHGREATKKGACPTCRKMVRFFRVPGLTAARMAELMEWYVTQGQVRAGRR